MFFECSGTRRIFVLAILLLGLGGCTKSCTDAKNPEESERHARGIIEIRLKFDKPSSGCTLMSYRSLPGKPEKKETVCVGNTVVMDDSAILHAEREDTTNGSPAFRVTLTTKGKKQLADLTRDIIGRQFALIIDGKLEMTPVIMRPITSGSFQIECLASVVKTRAATEERCDNLVRRLNETE